MVLVRSHHDWVVHAAARNYTNVVKGAVRAATGRTSARVSASSADGAGADEKKTSTAGAEAAAVTAGRDNDTSSANHAAATGAAEADANTVHAANPTPMAADIVTGTGEGDGESLDVLGVEGVDVSDEVKGHLEYRRALPKILARLRLEQ